MTASSRLSSLIHQLDALGADMPLAAIARVLNAHQLHSPDIATYIRPNSGNYNRVQVVRRPNYELLVMTWLPGQASVPHDHTGSVCAMQVVQGEAIEGDYSIASDGFVDLEYESRITSGLVSAGQDAGVHTIRNPSTSELLVTVHVYAPPLADFRRFVPRLEVREHPVESPDTVAVIGGGFCGTMVANHLLKQGVAEKIVLLERRGTVGEGLAYGTRDQTHLLNVPAARMSAFPDLPNHFLEWAKARDPSIQPGDFLPRMLYGDYLREILRETYTNASGKMEIRLDEARRVARHPQGGWMIHLGTGASFRARAVVVAIGHSLPGDPLRDIWQGPRDRFLRDPWRPFVLNGIGPDDSVAILGSGLTAIDTVLSLHAQPRSGRITLISRNGLLPCAHSLQPVAPADLSSLVEKLLAGTPGIARLASGLRREIARVLQQGGDWRSVVDGLRPHTQRIWKCLPLEERQRFLARLRPFWEVHRHRMAPAIANRLEELIQRGAVCRKAATISGAWADKSGVNLACQIRGNKDPEITRYDWVINCTGPSPSNRPETNPVVGSLLVHGWVNRDAISLGLETDEEGRALSSSGETVPDLFIVGTLRKPLLWESTAVPELRVQAEKIAGLVKETCRTS